MGHLLPHPGNVLSTGNILTHLILLTTLSVNAISISTLQITKPRHTDVKYLFRVTMLISSRARIQTV